jgi:hypothetical protein
MGGETYGLAWGFHRSLRAGRPGGVVSTRLHDVTLEMGGVYLNTVLELVQPVTQRSLSDAAQKKHHGKHLP